MKFVKLCANNLCSSEYIWKRVRTEIRIYLVRFFIFWLVTFFVLLGNSKTFAAPLPEELDANGTTLLETTPSTITVGTCIYRIKDTANTYRYYQSKTFTPNKTFHEFNLPDSVPSQEMLSLPIFNCSDQTAPTGEISEVVLTKSGILYLKNATCCLFEYHGSSIIVQTSKLKERATSSIIEDKGKTKKAIVGVIIVGAALIGTLLIVVSSIVLFH